jgi:hypothetical protein
VDTVTAAGRAEKFFDELEVAIKEERPLKLVSVADSSGADDLLKMWEDGAISL